MNLEEAFTKGWMAGASGSDSTRDESDAAFAHDLKNFIAALKRDRTFTLSDISDAVTKACTCGGATCARNDVRCPACEVWRRLTL